MAYRVYPPGTLNPTGPIVNKPEGYHHNWLTQLLPYMEEQNVFNHVDFQVGRLRREKRAGAESPRECAPLPVRFALSDTGGVELRRRAPRSGSPINADKHGVFFLNSVVRYENITDGTSHTHLHRREDHRQGHGAGLDVGHACDVAEYRDGTERRQAAPPCSFAGGMPGEPAAPASDSATADQKVGGFSSRHPGGTQFAFGDGHVAFVSNTIPPEVLHNSPIVPTGNCQEKAWSTKRRRPSRQEATARLCRSASGRLSAGRIS